ncbi:ABC transporter substrate-binding protein [Candidatus Margulisiibacteriota bacterium]
MKVNKIVFTLSIVISLSILSPCFGIQNKILILNSDSSLKRYQEIQNNYIKHIKNVTVIDLQKTDMRKINEEINTEKPALIFCIGTKALLQVLDKKDCPVVFASVLNWERFKISNNVYGVANELLAAMQLFNFRLLFPNIKKIGIVYTKEINNEWVKKARTAAADMQVKIIARALKNDDKLEDIIDELLNKTDALWLIPDPTVVNKKSINLYIGKANEKRKPIFAYSDLFVKLGAVLAITPDVPTIANQAASLTIGILNNEEFARQVQSPAGSKIVLHMKKVKQYQQDLNYRALGSVNEIIE